MDCTTAHTYFLDADSCQPQEWTYAPGEVSVKVGITVVWTNTGGVAHTVTADDGQAFDSGTIDPKSTACCSAARR
jgi:plastocyanin